MPSDVEPAVALDGPAPRVVKRLRRMAFGAGFGVILALLVGFGALAEDVWEREPFAWDRSLMDAVHTLALPWLDTVMVAATHLGSPLAMQVVAAVVALALYARRHRRHAAFVITSSVGAGLLNGIAKLFFQRPRPDLWVPLVLMHDSSFPSGHAMVSMAIALALVTLAWPTRWRWPSLVAGALFVAIVGASRVYVGVHYPSDVAAGWLASAAWVMTSRAAILHLDGPTRHGRAAWRAVRGTIRRES